jgi:hypothetical protein
VVWVGANDVLASVSDKVGNFFRFWKRLPVEPSLEWFCENIQSIATRLKCKTSARVALCSLPPIGEDLSSTHLFQIELNRRIEKYSSIIRDVALNERVSYVPVYEEIAAKIRALPGRAFTSFRFLPFYRDAFRVIILHKSLDEVSQMNGWNFHTDGVHLNSRAGYIVADLVQAFLDGSSVTRRPPWLLAGSLGSVSLLSSATMKALRLPFSVSTTSLRLAIDTFSCLARSLAHTSR